MDTVLHHKTSSAVIKSIPLSNNMVQRQVDEMPTNMEDRLGSIIRSTELSLQLNKTTLLRNQSLLLGYVCFVYDEILHEELEMALSLNTDMQGEMVF